MLPGHEDLNEKVKLFEEKGKLINTSSDQNSVENKYYQAELLDDSISNQVIRGKHTADSENKKGKKKKKIKNAVPKEYTAEELSDLLARRDRMVTDLKEEFVNYYKDQGKISDTEAEIAEIDKVIDLYHQYAGTEKELKGNTGKSFSFEEFGKAVHKLRFKKSMDVSHLLINDHSKNDSPEMKALKSEVLRLSYHLEAVKNITASKEEINDLLTYYEVCLKYCSDYIDSKKHNKRFEKVYKVWESFSVQAAYLKMVKNTEFGPDETIGSVLGMRQPKLGDRKRITQHKHSVGDEALCSQDILDVRALFSSNYNFIDSFAALNSVKEKKKLAKQYYELFENLKAFTPGDVSVQDLKIMGKNIRVLQTADNKLYAIDKQTHAHYLLGNVSAKDLSNSIVNTMLRKPELYDAKAIHSLVEDFQDRINSNDAQVGLGDYTKIRDSAIELLSAKLGIQKDRFNNLKVSDMIFIAEDLTRVDAKGKSLPKKVLDEKKAQALSIIDNAKKSIDYINGIELTEMLEKEDAAQLQGHVSMYQIQADADDNDFSQDEKAVKNLMAELVLPSDTMIMDKYINRPGEYVRQILKENVRAFKLLVSENSVNNEDMISTIIKKMSLDKISHHGMDFSNDIVKSLRGLVTYFKGKGDVDIEALLSDTENAELNNKLALANAEMEDSILKASFAMQGNVNKIVGLMFAPKEAAFGVNELDVIIKNASRNQSGQGLFTRKVLENYFKSVSILDQRAMLSSAIRSCRKVVIKNKTDRELLEEVKKENLIKYKPLSRAYMSDLTEEQRSLLNEYRQEKEALQVGANYFAGLIRGAGPLLHKMLQGIPEADLPEEIRLAIRDVKSRLQPIPERVVKAQLNAMIQRSRDKKITRIEVTDNLGAASVGQTFRCKVFGPDLPQEGEYVVIKLLRPDCQNRMKREEKVMLICAKAVNDGIYETYKGQLNNYYDELDLSKEGKNIDEGKVYDNRDDLVASEKRCTLVDPTANTVMIEQAEGKTLDDILINTASFIKKSGRDLYGTYVDDDGVVQRNHSIPYTPEKIEMSKKLRSKYIEMANDLIKKRDMLAAVSKVWIQEALFKSGYYHADLHAGNILLSDKKATLIDFGNAVKFTPEQQISIVRMMTAAAASKTDLFFEEFNKLLDMKDEKFAKFYTKEVRDNVQAEFDRILKMGAEEDAGLRISAALIKASELGVKLPPAIYNFSQGQMRLQKSIDDCNDMIHELDGTVYELDRGFRSADNKALGLNVIINKTTQQAKNRKEFESIIRSHYNEEKGVDKEEFISELLDDTYFEADLVNGEAEVSKRKEFNQKYLTNVYGLKDMLILANDQVNRAEMFDFKGARKRYYEYRDKWNKAREEIKNDKNLTEEERNEKNKDLDRKIMDAANNSTQFFLPMNMGEPIYLSLGIMNLVTPVMLALNNLDDDAMESLFYIYEQVIPSGLELEEKVNELRDLQDSEELTEEKKNELTEEIYRLYVKHEKIKKKNDPYSTNLKFELSRVQLFENTMKTDLAMVISEKTKTTYINKDGRKEEITYGKLFEKKANEYLKIATKYHKAKNELWNMKNMPKDDEQKVKELVEELCDINREITKIHLKRFYENRYEDDIDVKSYSFADVMKSIINNNRKDFIAKLGIFEFAKIVGGKVWDYMMG